MAGPEFAANKTARGDGARRGRTNLPDENTFFLSVRELAERATKVPMFITAISAVSHGRLVPVPGGVLIKNGSGEVLGAVGISGDTSDRDESCAVAGIEAAGLAAAIGAS